MGIELKIGDFQGPLDLLLQLIAQEKVDILDIPIARITEQYNQVISSWNLFDLEEASDYIVMAARLMQIKARMLLPRPPRGQEEEDPRQELAAQLAQYAVYQRIAAFSESREIETARAFTRDPEYIPEMPAPLAEVNLKALERSMRRLLADRQIRQDPQELLRPERFSIEEKKDALRRLLSKRRRISFKKTLSRAATAEEVIAVFLAMLELYKTGVLDFEQYGSEIIITAEDPAAPKQGRTA